MRTFKTTSKLLFLAIFIWFDLKTSCSAHNLKGPLKIFDRSSSPSELFKFHQFDEAPYKLYRRDDQELDDIDSDSQFLKPVKRHYLEWAREEALNDAKLFMNAYKRWGNGYGVNSKRATRYSPRHLPLF